MATSISYIYALLLRLAAVNTTPTAEMMMPRDRASDRDCHSNTWTRCLVVVSIPCFVDAA